MPAANKKKIINDPVYGFLSIPTELIFDLIEHRYFQRLRRIKQLGLSYLVYPGAIHSRFHHALGAMHLTSQAIENLRAKDVEISDDEACGLLVAILLHDIGHGPFSHTLEKVLVPDVHHEEISLLLMHKLNEEFQGKLDTAIRIFTGDHPRKFLHQLISSQLDMDRLDYLMRDSFYTGVSEGVVGYDRIIKMLHVHNDELVVEEKGIYSIEKFLIARRLMYWQVYLHKTVIAADVLLINILKRAKELIESGNELFATPAFRLFLNAPDKAGFFTDRSLIERFSELDDHDVMASIKVWASHSDKVLSRLCSDLLLRKLPRVLISRKEASEEELQEIISRIAKKDGLSREEASFFVDKGILENKAYAQTGAEIQILLKDGSTMEIAEASDTANIASLVDPVKKYYLSYPKYI